MKQKFLTSDKGVLNQSFLRVATNLNPEIENTDVNTPFLLENLDEEIHIEKSKGFKAKDKENFVYGLKKSL